MLNLTFLPAPTLPYLRRPRPSFHPPVPSSIPLRMLSQSARTLLGKVRTGLVHPICPKSLGLTERFPSTARLFVDHDTGVAVVLSTRRSRFARQHAATLLSFIRPLMQDGAVDNFVIALAGDGAVGRDVEIDVEGMGGELVRKEQFLEFAKELREEGESKKDGGDNDCDDEIQPATALDVEIKDLEWDNSGRTDIASASPLTELSKRRRREAMKRERRSFGLCAEHRPAGDQPKAIRFLTDGLLRHGREYQTLHGITGVGKTFIMANIIAKVNVPTLILAPNKTLAAQLCSELSKYFPENRVEFFVSHFKHYQPEAYMPSSDKYIAKTSSVDQDIDRLRHAATRSLFERNDTIVVASVSSIYGLGLPTEYLEASLRIHVGDELGKGIEELTEGLVGLNYVEDKHHGKVSRGFFRVETGFIDVSPPWESEGTIYRITFGENVVVRMTCLDNDAGKGFDLGAELVLYPARHFITPKDRLEVALKQIEEETRQCADSFRKAGKSLEATRLEERVMLDIEMMRKVGYCNGAENYSLYLTGRNKSSNPTPPQTLIDYMPRDGKWLLFVDESHVTVPQLGAMYAGNAARKRKLIQYGFRLPSAMENRPLNSKEFWQKTHQTVFVSATPGSFELERSGRDGTVQAVIRPTGVLDPTVEVVDTTGQIEHLTLALAKVAAKGGKAIVTTITKRFAEDLAECIAKKPPVPGVLDRPLRVSFLHSGIDSVGRMQVLEAMRNNFSQNKASGDNEHNNPELGLDVVVGVNLLREGIDLPAVRLVAILDADAEGFLRGETALIQTMGRAARNVDGHIIMYADSVTTAMQRAIDETARRRSMQIANNSVHGINPTGASSQASPTQEDGDVLLNRIRKLRLEDGSALTEKKFGTVSHKVRKAIIQDNLAIAGIQKSADFDELRNKMLHAAQEEDFETAATLRDHLINLMGTSQSPVNGIARGTEVCVD